MDEPCWKELAKQRAADLSAKTAEGECPSIVEAPGLLVGLAGIGYGLLRLAYPERVPSVLVLAPPQLV